MDSNAPFWASACPLRPGPGAYVSPHLQGYVDGIIQEEKEQKEEAERMHLGSLTSITRASFLLCAIEEAGPATWQMLGFAKAC